MGGSKRHRTDAADEETNPSMQGGRGGQQTLGVVAAATSQSTPVMLMDDPKILLPPLNLPQALVRSCLKGDVLLVCKGNQAVQCHSQILACASEVIGDMLESTGVLTDGNENADGLVSIPMIEDEAEHWLHALVHLYPLPMPGVELTPAQAMAAATLSHKYNIAKLADAFDQWLESLQTINPCSGHYKYVVPNFAKCMKPHSVTSSPIFRAAGTDWKLQVNSHHDANQVVTSMFAFLLPASNSAGVPCKRTTATFAIALVNHLDPVVQSVVHKEKRVCSNYLYNYTLGYGWGQMFAPFAPISHFQDAAKGYIKDGSVEFHVTMMAEPPAGCAQEANKECYLSDDPESDLYVFRWRELAGKVKNTGLEDKCMEFVRSNAHQVIFNKQFAQDLHEAMRGMTAGQAVSVMRSLQL